MPVWVRSAACLCVAFGACSEKSQPKSKPKPESQAAKQVQDCERLRVAFIGDAGTSTSARSVLQLIKDEGAQFVVHQGDLGYGDASGWVGMVDDVLGKQFPYVFSSGNHDLQNAADWSTFYMPFLRQRIAATDELRCESEDETLRRLSCRFHNVHVVLTEMADGSSRSESEQRTHSSSYLERKLRRSNADWKVCSWHVPGLGLALVQDEMIGVTSEPYEVCASHGAFIATAHFHHYSRTKTITSFEPARVAPDANNVEVGGGRTFAFVSGLGGNGIDELSCRPPSSACPMWARGHQGSYGALFIDFGCGANANEARGRFVAIDGTVVDDFRIATP